MIYIFYNLYSISIRYLGHERNLPWGTRVICSNHGTNSNAILNTDIFHFTSITKIWNLISNLRKSLLFAIYQVMLEASSFSPTPVDLLHQECVSLDSIQVCIEQKPVFWMDHCSKTQSSQENWQLIQTFVKGMVSCNKDSISLNVLRQLFN